MTPDLPPILARDYRRHAVYPILKRIVYLLSGAIFALIFV